MNKQPSQIFRDQNVPQIKQSTFCKFINLMNDENFHMVIHMLELIKLLGCSEREYCFMMEHYEDLELFFSNNK